MGNSLLASTRGEGEGLEEEDTLSNDAHIPRAIAGCVTGGKKKEEESWYRKKREGEKSFFPRFF